MRVKTLLKFIHPRDYIIIKTKNHVFFWKGRKEEISSKYWFYRAKVKRVYASCDDIVFIIDKNFIIKEESFNMTLKEFICVWSEKQKFKIILSAYADVQLEDQPWIEITMENFRSSIFGLEAKFGDLNVADAYLDNDTIIVQTFPLWAQQIV